MFCAGLTKEVIGGLTDIITADTINTTTPSTGLWEDVRTGTSVELGPGINVGRALTTAGVT